jgi:SAM-dependent methyltransferase
LAEFTGERIIPGKVDVDLLNEHVARYTFAARLARGKRVLDAGCGAGYGSAELAQAADSVVGVDRAPEAIEFARASYGLPNLRFEQASCEALPHPDGSFDLVVAFEVVEHLENWREFLLEARRVLAPAGQLVISTPNKLYYTESRGPTGANPFHVHEFNFEEFQSELQAVFPYVSMYLENHVEGVTFQPHEAGHTVEVRVDAGDPAPDESHFFVAVCAHRRQLGNPTYVYVPRAANVLRERERHIALLEGELATKDEWLDKAQQDLAEFDRLSRQQKEELERSNQWADTLNQEIEERRARIVELQEEFAREQENARKVAEGYAAKFREQEEERERSDQWAEALNREIEERRARIVELQEEFAREQENARKAIEGREEELKRSNQWAEALNREIEERRARIVELQEEFAREQENARQVAEGYAAKVAALERDNRDKAQWAIDTQTNLTAVIRDQEERLSVAVAHLSTAVEALHHTEKELEERTAWALRLQDEARRLEEQVALFRASRWVKLGRTVGLGPV